MRRHYHNCVFSTSQEFSFSSVATSRLREYRCKLWFRPENVGFNYVMPALWYLVLVASPTFCGYAAPVYDKTQCYAWASAKSQLEGSQTIAHSIAIHINEMTTAKGRFIVLFLLGLSQYSAYWHLFVVIFTTCQSETSNLRKGLQLYLGLTIIFLYSLGFPVISKEDEMTGVLKVGVVCLMSVPEKGDCTSLVIHIKPLAMSNCATRGALSQEISSNFPCKHKLPPHELYGESGTLKNYHCQM